MESPASALGNAPDGEDPGIQTESGEETDRSGDIGSLAEIVEQLESDPEERWHAMEGLGLVEPEVRLAIIAELSRHEQKSGTSSLLRLLCSARDLVTRDAVRLRSAFRGRRVNPPPGVRFVCSSRHGC